MQIYPTHRKQNVTKWARAGNDDGNTHAKAKYPFQINTHTQDLQTSGSDVHSYLKVQSRISDNRRLQPIKSKPQTAFHERLKDDTPSYKKRWKRFSKSYYRSKNETRGCWLFLDKLNSGFQCVSIPNQMFCFVCGGGLIPHLLSRGHGEVATNLLMVSLSA